MSEIKREPRKFEIHGRELVAFDEDHTLSDFIRYLLTQGDREEIKYLAEHVE